jgi:PAS domain S-box-containing protein
MTFELSDRIKQLEAALAAETAAREKAEDALDKSDFFLNRSQDAGGVGSFVLNIPKDDLEAQTWECTPEMDRIFGIDATYPKTGESWLALIVQRDEVETYFSQQVFDTQKNFEKEYQITRPSDGEVRWIFGRGELEFDDQGNCRRMIGTAQDITDRKRSEALLRQSQIQLSEAMKIARTGHWEYDVASDTFTFNDHFYRIFRTTVEKVGGYRMSSAEYIRRFCHPEDAHIVDKEVQTAIEISDPKYSPLIEYRILYTDGEVGHVMVRFFIVKDGQGRTIRCFGVIQDITERKKSEESLRFTQFAIDNTIDQAFWTTADGHIVYVNDAACRTLGYTREELLKMSIPDIGPTFPPEVFEQHWRDLQKNGYATFESFHRGKSGRVYPVEIRANYVQFGGKEYNCAFATDITERKRMEQSVRESESRLRTLLQTIPDLIWLKDENGVFLNCNSSFERLMGAGKEDIIGKTDYDFLDSDLADSFRENDHKAIAAGGPTSNEEWVTFADNGQRALLETIKTPMLDSEGNLVGVLGVARDITDRERARKEKDRLQEQLQQAQKMESVGRLAGGVAHDFNNMMGVILGHTELSLEIMQPADPSYMAFNEIKKAAERSAALTSQLLAFARKQTIAPRVLDINEAVGGMLKMLRRLIGEDIELVWQPEEGVWPVKMDASQVDQILANLCLNARDAINGQGNITIETDNVTIDEAYSSEHLETEPGDFVMLMVSDTGVGMDKTTIEKIFEPFFTTKEMGEGTGLGLATIYGIVKQNNGFINVYSEPGHGSVFKTYLPRHLDGSYVPQVEDDFPLEVAKGNETVLLVEDEVAILKMAKLQLERSGYQVIAASTPGEAIQAAKEHAGKIHLLMTDVIMPEMNGWDLAMELTALHPEIRILFMSGYTADIIAHHGILDKGYNFIEKPFSFKKVREKVREVLDKVLIENQL